MEPLDDILQEAGLAQRLLANARQLSDHLSEKSYLDFNIDDSIEYFMRIEQIPLPRPLEPDECHSIREEAYDDTNHLEDLSLSPPERPRPLQVEALLNSSLRRHLTTPDDLDQVPGVVGRQQMEQIIEWLVERAGSGRADLPREVEAAFPGALASETVSELVQKFGRLKKTKEELVKYCMRKAVKFILELPKNKQLLAIDKQQKFSFSKCKNRFLRNISEEKSMNNKFLQQIFQEEAFSQDYALFLRHFPNIMLTDNQRKVQCLAQLLTQGTQGKPRTLDMVKRLPWTRTILDKVAKISHQLLKYSALK